MIINFKIYLQTFLLAGWEKVLFGRSNRFFVGEVSGPIESQSLEFWSSGEGRPVRPV